MVRIKVQGTQQQINLLTKAARHTGLATPNKFLTALFDGNHIPRKRKLDPSAGPGPTVSTPRRKETRDAF